jgi:hypothetical protein
MTTSFDYDTISVENDINNTNWINNRLLSNTDLDHTLGLEPNPKAFTPLFAPGSVSTFYLKLEIDSFNTINDMNDQPYRVEARFARPDISSTHIDVVRYDRSPLPNFSNIDITKLSNTDDLSDPRQNKITYEYNFQVSPEQCSNLSPENCPDYTSWDNPSSTIQPQQHVGMLYKFVVIIHTMKGHRYYYPYKFILSPFNAGNSLQGVNLINISSFVDDEFHESSLLIFESQQPRYTAPVILRTEALEKITFNSNEDTSTTRIQTTTNSIINTSSNQTISITNPQYTSTSSEQTISTINQPADTPQQIY